MPYPPDKSDGTPSNPGWRAQSSLTPRAAVTKLTVRIVDATAVGGGKALILCDEHGESLPMQIGSDLSCNIDEVPLLTVRFRIDGDDIRLIG